MSGIFGIIRPAHRPVMELELAPIAEALKHRGPDGINFSVRENAGMGHCMLWSTPESLHETLPFRDAASGLTITADARIDNRKQLLAGIGVSPTPGQLVGDSQLILKAYMKWGEACVEHLLGDFAFAIWDERAQTLFAARDHMGCKPLYYYHSRCELIFSSSALGIEALESVSVSVNRGRVADCLVSILEGVDNTSTFFENVLRLPPGHLMSYSGGTLKFRCYWQPTLAAPIRYAQDDDYLEAFKEIFELAVSDRLRAHGRPAAMLSGGVDSSVIAAIARTQLLGRGADVLQTYSAIDDSTGHCKEAFHARLLVSQGGFEGQEIVLNDIQRFSKELDDWRRGLEDPFDFEMIVNALVHLRASANGNRVVLSGLDGDLVAGLPHSYIAHIVRAGHGLEAWREARKLVKNNASYASTAVGEMFMSSVRAVIPQAFRELRRPLRLRNLVRNTINTTFISKDFAAEIDLKARLALYLGNPGREDLAHSHQRALRAPFLTAAIERYERVAAWGGVESRHPLLDRRVIDFVLNVPRQQKFRHGWTKYLLRRLAELHTPPEIAWRTTSDHPGWRYNGHWGDHLREAGLREMLAAGGKLRTGIALRPGDIAYPKGAVEAREMEVRVANMVEWLEKLH